MKRAEKVRKAYKESTENSMRSIAWMAWRERALNSMDNPCLLFTAKELEVFDDWYDKEIEL